MGKLLQRQKFSQLPSKRVFLKKIYQKKIFNKNSSSLILIKNYFIIIYQLI
jgi:hypothetical protein